MGAIRKIEAADLGFRPAAMTWDLALAYTGVGEQQMRAWQKRGLVRFRANGPRGALVTSTAQLDEAVRQMFTGGPDLSEDMDFGD